MEVLSNSDGEILSNSNGDLLGPNYNFGKAFEGRTSFGAWVTTFTSNLSSWLTVPDLIGQPIPPLMSVLCWGKHTSQFNEGLFDIKASNGFIVTAGGNTQIIIQLVTTSGTALGFPHDTDSVSPVLIGYRSGMGFKNGSAINVDSVPISGNFSDIKIGIGYYSYDQPTRYWPGTIGEFLMLDRSFSDDEYNVYYNNGLGNDFPNLGGVMLHYKMRKAEILTIGGVDDVGIRNEAQNAFHAKINGLPAGTLEEKVAWANANMFVNFL